jgi:tripartite-type tricarboxylate transporter receptor subunit TctC
MTTRRGFMGLLTIAAFGLDGRAHAQRWPEKPVRVIVPFSAGGLTDGIARLVSQRLAENLGQAFVIENMTGGAGTIAARTVARAPADGYTIFLASLTQIGVLPAIEDVAYDPVKDFAPVSNVASTPFVLMVHPSFQARTLSEFVDHVRAHPGKLAYGSAGAGSVSHLAMALLLKRAGLDMIHVPYRGGSQVVPDLVAGHVTSYFGNRTDAVPQARAGTVRLLAVADDRRSDQFPDVPTVIESGYPGFRAITWNGLMVPAATPKPIIDQLAREVQRIVKEPAFLEKAANFGLDLIGDTPQEFAATIAADVPLWAEAVAVAGARRQ